MEDGREQVLLRPEVAVERLLRDAERAREVRERGGTIAVLAEQLGGRGEDLRAREGAAGGAEAAASQW
jgi:hypothetical protein